MGEKVVLFMPAINTRCLGRKKVIYEGYRNGVNSNRKRSPAGLRFCGNINIFVLEFIKKL